MSTDRNVDGAGAGNGAGNENGNGGWTGSESDDVFVAAGIGQGTADLHALAAVSVVSGAPDDDELAALLAGIATARALSRADSPDGEAHAGAGGPGRGDAWGDHARRLGVRTPGPDAWRWSNIR